MSCHQETGKGVGKLIPPISGEFLKIHHSEMACIIRNGVKGKLLIDGIEYNHEMPANTKLSKIDIVNILNYVEEIYGSGNKKSFDVEQVENSLKNCK